VRRFAPTSVPDAKEGRPDRRRREPDLADSDIANPFHGEDLHAARYLGVP
jgi:hypothetical protein